jgi:YegS/Rv2252/BmrU family lipid kinase
MDKEKAYLVIHPKAEQHVADILTIFEERWETTPLVTAYAGHGIEIAANAQEQGYHWVIAYGGDGTLNEVVNGALQAPQPCIIGVLPGGTVNQWAHEIGLPAHPIDAARTLIRSTPRSVDIGFIEVHALEFPDEIHYQHEIESKATARHHFLLIAGLGIDAATIQTTTESSKQQFGQLAFVLDWLQTLPEMHPFPVQVRWSTAQSWEGQPLEILVSNTRRYANVGNLIPEAFVNDGLLDIRILSIFSPENVLFHPFQDHSFSLRVPASIALQLDGSSMQLADYVSQENWTRLQEATDLDKIMVTYRFTVKPSALPMAIPWDYVGELFNGTLRH